MGQAGEWRVWASVVINKIFSIFVAHGTLSSLCSKHTTHCTAVLHYTLTLHCLDVCMCEVHPELSIGILCRKLKKKVQKTAENLQRRYITYRKLQKTPCRKLVFCRFSACDLDLSTSEKNAENLLAIQLYGNCRKPPQKCRKLQLGFYQ